MGSVSWYYSWCCCCSTKSEQLISTALSQRFCMAFYFVWMGHFGWLAKVIRRNIVSMCLMWIFMAMTSPKSKRHTRIWIKMWRIHARACTVYAHTDLCTLLSLSLALVYLIKRSMFVVCKLFVSDNQAETPACLYRFGWRWTKNQNKKKYMHSWYEFFYKEVDHKRNTHEKAQTVDGIEWSACSSFALSKINEMDLDLIPKSNGKIFSRALWWVLPLDKRLITNYWPSDWTVWIQERNVFEHFVECNQSVNRTPYYQTKNSWNESISKACFNQMICTNEMHRDLRAAKVRLRRTQDE